MTTPTEIKGNIAMRKSDEYINDTLAIYNHKTAEEIPAYKSFTLSLPPSANRYWRKFRNRMVISQEALDYKANMKAAYYDITPYTGEVGVSIDVFRARKAGDLDNYLKVILDSLKGIAYADDSQIIVINARRFDDKDSPRAVITVFPV